MTTDSVYTVTPPDLRITDTGPTVLLLGVEFDENDPYTTLFDSLFPHSEVTVYTSENGMDNDNIAWYRAVASMASSLIIDLDNATAEDVFIGMQVESEDRATVFWMAPKQSKPMLVKLLNSYQYSIFQNIEEIRAYIDTDANNNG